MHRYLRQFLFGGPGVATRLGDIGLAVARVGFGAAMIYGHGYAKVFRNGFGPDQAFIDGVQEMGFPAPVLFAWMAALAEFLGASLLALGLFTRPMALILVINMSVALFIRHATDPFLVQERALLYLLAFVMFALVGGGRFSIDAAVRNRRAM